MGRRILDVTAFTTLDVVRASARGVDWTDEATAVLDVDTADEDRPGVTLDVELDPTELERVEPHAETIDLSPTEARTLADALREAADAAQRRGPEEVNGN